MPSAQRENASPDTAAHLGQADPQSLFFRRFLAKPREVASFMPSSSAFSRAIARQVRRAPDEHIVELGAGTGAVTRALLTEAGVPEEKLTLVERDGEMARYLRHAFPRCHVLESDVFDVVEGLPKEAVGKVGTVICGVPMALFDLEDQRRLADLMFSLMPADRRFVMLTYRPAPPIPGERLGLIGRRLETTFWNLPPASVWGYARSEAAFAGNGRGNGAG